MGWTVCSFDKSEAAFYFNLVFNVQSSIFDGPRKVSFFFLTM